MDNPRFDEIVKKKLESFSDHSEVNEAALLTVLDKAETPVTPHAVGPWPRFKPYALAAGISLLLISNLFLFYTHIQQKQRVKDLQEDLRTLVQPDNPPPSADLGSVAESADLSSSTSEKPGTRVKQHSSGSWQESGKQATYSAPHISEKSREPTRPDKIFISNIGLGAIPMMETGAGFPAPDLPLLSTALFPRELVMPETLSPSLVQNSLIFGEEKVHIQLPDEDLWEHKPRFGIQVGVSAGIAKPFMRYADAPPVVPIGLKGELLFSDYFRVYTGADVYALEYSIRDIDYHSGDFDHYPSFPSLVEGDVIEEIRTRSNIVEMPFQVKLALNRRTTGVKLFVGAGLSTRLVSRQSFDYKVYGSDEIPSGIANKSSLVFNSFNLSWGPEFTLNPKTYLQMAVFYQNDFAPQGLDRVKYSTLGLSTSVWFRRI